MLSLAWGSVDRADMPRHAETQWMKNQRLAGGEASQSNEGGKKVVGKAEFVEKNNWHVLFDRP